MNTRITADIFSSSIICSQREQEKGGRAYKYTHDSLLQNTVYANKQLRALYHFRDHQHARPEHLRDRVEAKDFEEEQDERQRGEHAARRIDRREWLAFGDLPRRACSCIVRWTHGKVSFSAVHRVRARNVHKWSESVPVSNI